MLVEIAIGVAAALVAAALVYAFMRAGVAEARAGAKAAESMLASGERRFGELIEAQRRETEGRIAALRAEFSSLAASTLEGKAKSLAEQNAAQVKPLFDQLRIKFDEFRRAADDAQASNLKLGSALQARIARYSTARTGSCSSTRRSTSPTSSPPSTRRAPATRLRPSGS